MSIPLNCPFLFPFNSVASSVNRRLLLLLNWETWRDPNLTSSSAVDAVWVLFCVCKSRNFSICFYFFIFKAHQRPERSGKKDCARFGGGCMGHIHIVKFSRPISKAANSRDAWSRKSDKVFLLQLQPQTDHPARRGHLTTKWRRAGSWWAGNDLHHDVFINKL